MSLQKQIQALQKEIFDWYRENKRNLPWRQDRDPYHILISEVMLQQTQVQRVIPKYHKWLKVFPTLEALSKATTREVLRYWSGLGYNRRALFLKACAEEVVAQKQWPRTEHELIKLPGIGKYTASAILCFAFNQQIAVVDTNIKKVILVKLLKKQTASEKKIEEIAKKMLPKGRAYEWNQALMDYASAMLKNHKIVIPKQTKFKNSDRYLRGQILKYLIHHQQVTILEFVDLFSKLQVPIETKRLIHVLDGLIQDHFILRSSDIYSIIS